MKEKILDILSHNLEIESTNHDTITKENIPNWDSIRSLMIITDIESEFNISFTPEEIEMIDSFDSIYSLMKEKLPDNAE